MNDDARLRDGQLPPRGDVGQGTPPHRLGAKTPLPLGDQPFLHAAAVAAAPVSTTAVYAALDLGTNNCRLLIACPTEDGFRVVDSFSRIIRLGEGVSATGRISEAAIERAIA